MSHSKLSPSADLGRLMSAEFPSSSLLSLDHVKMVARQHKVDCKFF